MNIFKKILIGALVFLFVTTTAYAAILSVPQGGTGKSTLTGILQGNGTAPFTPITIGDGLSFSGSTLFNTGADSLSTLPVRVATIAVLPGSPTYSNGASGVGATLTRGSNGTVGTIDTITPFTIGDRILVKDQASQLQNGIYQFTTVGDASNPYVLTRTTDSDATTELDDQVVAPALGNANTGKTFGQQTISPVVGTNAIVYTVGPVSVKQQTSGTQVLGQIPWWTNAARTLSKGNQDFTWIDTTKEFTVAHNGINSLNIWPDFGIYRMGNVDGVGGNTTLLDLQDSTGVTTLGSVGGTTPMVLSIDSVNQIFAVQYGASFNNILKLDSTNHLYSMGDVDGAWAGSSLVINDATQVISLGSGTTSKITLNKTLGTVRLGGANSYFQYDGTNRVVASSGNTYFDLASDFTGAAWAPQTLRFYEQGDNGSNFVGFKAATALSTDTTWIWPTADATIAGQFLSSNGSGVLSWASGGGGGGSGTVTSVSFTGGLISVANPTTTPALTVAGTSGGIPYFSSASTWASSGALTASALVLGGGAGATPTSLALGTANQVLGMNNAGTAHEYKTLAGTGSQITVTQGVGTTTLSIPATFTPPGSLNPVNYTYIQGGTTDQEAGAEFIFLGATTRSILTVGSNTSTLTANNSLFSETIAQSTITEAGSGTHPIIGALGIRSPVINNGAGATTNASTLYIEGAPTGTATPANVYALWIDDGSARIDGNLLLSEGGVINWDNGDATLTQVGDVVTLAGADLKISTPGTASTSVATIDGTQTLTNKRITQRVVSLSDATSFTLSLDTADMNTQANTQATGTLTANAPSGTPTDGQKIVFRIKSTNVQTYAWNAIFRGGTYLALPITSTGSSKTDYLGFIYNSADTKYDFVSYTPGL